MEVKQPNDVQWLQLQELNNAPESRKLHSPWLEENGLEKKSCQACYGSLNEAPLMECVHFLCYACAVNYPEKKCGECKAPFDVKTKNSFALRLYEESKGQCLFKPWGCTQEVTMGLKCTEFWNHVENCRFRIKECKDCNKWVFVRDVDHITTCENALKRCLLCFKQLRISAEGKDHVFTTSEEKASCPGIVACPYKCSSEIVIDEKFNIKKGWIPLEKFEEHKKHCDNRNVKCKCGDVIKHAQLSNHILEDLKNSEGDAPLSKKRKHLTWLLEKRDVLDDENKRLKKRIKELEGQLDNTNEEKQKKILIEKFQDLLKNKKKFYGRTRGGKWRKFTVLGIFDNFVYGLDEELNQKVAFHVLDKNHYSFENIAQITDSPISQSSCGGFDIGDSVYVKDEKWPMTYTGRVRDILDNEILIENTGSCNVETKNMWFHYKDVFILQSLSVPDYVYSGDNIRGLLSRSLALLIAEQFGLSQ